MTAPDPARVFELFDRGRGLQGADRERFVSDIADETLRAEVASLLASAARAPRFLEARQRRDIGLVPGTDVGRYRIGPPLGRGGHGHVYRARHVGTGAEVALKTVGRLGDESAATIRREIATLQSLRHPGVVRILDHGVHDAVPWYTMALESGNTLDALLSGADGDAQTEALPRAARATADASGVRTWPTAAARPPGARSPETRRRLLEVIRRLCAPLAYIHGEGVVHRDLKPQNVIVRADGTPVLVDFGIVARAPRQGREALEAFAGMAGTVPYMAPEVIRGDLVDARVDLYALGCILYEVLTGTPPFVDGDVGEILRMHLDAEPAPPSSRADGVSPALDAIVLRLLAKAPENRFGYADDVAAALEEAGVPAPAREAGPRPRPYLYRPGLEGRDAALARVRARLHELEKDRGSILLLHGESGIGKTRLCLAAGREAWVRGIAVLAGGGAPPSSSGGSRSAGALHALLPVFRSIADRCRERGRPEVDALLGVHVPVLGAHVPVLAGVAEIGALPSPPPLPADAARLRLLMAVRAALHGMARSQRLLLILDDLHWADELTLDLLPLLARSGPEGSRLLILGTFRTTDAPPRLQSLRSQVESIEIRGIDGAGVGAMVHSMLASRALPEGFVDFLAQRSGGNPFYVAEYLRLAVGRGILVRDAHGSFAVGTGGRRYVRLPIPGSVRSVVEERLERLQPDAQDLLAALAVLGRQAATGLVARLADVPRTRRAAALQELVTAGIVEATDDGGCRFAHDRFREVGYARLSASSARRLHRLAAEAIRAGRPGPQTSADLAALAHHAERGGKTPEARRWYDEAARRAVTELLPAEAEALARASLRLTPRPDRASLKLRLLLANEMLRTRGRLKEALAEARRVRRDAVSLRARRIEASAWMSQANTEMRLGRFASCARSLRTARAMYRAAGDEIGEARAVAGLADTTPDVRRQRRLAEEALRLPAVRRDADARSLLLGTLARAATELGEPEEAERRYGEALAACRRGDDSNRMGLLVNRAIVRQDRGRIAEAVAGYEEALAWARRAGDAGVQASAMLNLGVILLEQGRLAEARRVLDECLPLLRDIEASENALALFNLGCIDELQGDDASAEQRFAEALRRFEKSGNLRCQKAAHCHMSGLAWRRGNVEAAQDHRARGLAITGADLGWDGRQLVVEARMLRCEGRLEEAAAATLEAERLLHASAFELGVCLCERGFVELAAGRDAAALHDRARQAMEVLEARPESKLGRAVAALDRAIAARTRGEPLVHGQVPSDLPGWVAASR